MDIRKIAKVSRKTLFVLMPCFLKNMKMRRS